MRTYQLGRTHKELQQTNTTMKISLDHRSTVLPGAGSSAHAAIIGHELIHLMLVDQLSGVLFWSFARLLQESCPA